MPWTEMTRSSNVIRRHMRDRDLTDSLCIHAPKTLKETDTTQKAKYHPPPSPAWCGWIVVHKNMNSPGSLQIVRPTMKRSKLLQILSLCSLCAIQIAAFSSPFVFNRGRHSASFPTRMAEEGSADESIGTVSESASHPDQTISKKKIAVVGGGWGGWGAAKALCQSKEDIEVILLDALPDPTGMSPYLSKTGKPVEAGTRGFWKDYPNINALCAELGLDENEVFTPFTNSSFYSPDGLEATAPVFSETKFPETELPFLSSLSGQPFPQLPSPLGQVLATFPLFERIPLADRASMVGLLLATIDCLGNDLSIQEKYDRMTAHDLFIRFGLSERLVEDFIKPTL